MNLRARLGGFRGRLVLAVGGTAIVAASLALYVGARFAVDTAIADMRARLQSIASLGALLVDAAQHEQVRTAGDPAHVALSRALQELLALNADVIYVYTVRPVDLAAGRWEFVVNVERGLVEPPGQPYAPGPAVSATLERALEAPLADTNLLADEWGESLSGYAPIRDASGRAVAVLGVDVPGDSVNALVRSIALAYVWVALATALFALLVSLLVARSLARPIGALADAARRVGGGDLTARVGLAPVRGRPRDELEELGERFDAMVAGLRASQSALVRAERLATIGRFTAGIAHELKNPLGGIANYVALLKRKVEPGSAPARYADAIELGLTQMDRVVRQLRDFRAEAEPRATPLDEALADVLVLLDHRLRKVGVEVERALDAGLPPLHADPNRLRQVLTNLVSNAVDALEAHRATAGEAFVARVRLSASRDLDNVKISVADNGAGIPEDRRATIFEAFYTTKETGTGLGLWLTHEMVHQHGGRIAVGEAEGGGARFDVWWPTAPRGA